MKLILTLLLCALLSPASVSAADLQQPTPISAAETEQSSADSTELPSADSTEPPALDTIPSPDLTSLLAAQEAATQELARLHDFLVEIWQHVRFWAVAALAYWFSKKSWQGVT